MSESAERSSGQMGSAETGPSPISKLTAFFEQAHQREFVYFGYDDIQLRTERISDLDAFEDVSLAGNVSTHYRLRNPILGAAMNSISEDRMAIAMGKLGGGAFVHHANTPAEQCALVENVYSHMSGVIRNPFTALADETIAEVLGKLEKRDKPYRTLPVIDSEGRCVGLMDKTCFRLFDSSTPISEAMRPLGSFVTAPAETTPAEAYEIMREQRLGVLPLLDSARMVGGLCLSKDVARFHNSNPKEYSLNPEGRLITFASVPTKPEEAVERVRLMLDMLDVVGIDTSHGEHRDALDTLAALKENFGDDVDILAANISTEQVAIEVARLEPDGMVVGQGPGSICSSSDRLGFGTPQASAVYEVSKGARSINPEMPIIADGGIKDSQDTVKAFALGATAVKVGGLIAGTDETPVPELKDENGNPYKEYWGMGSEKAQRTFAAARARYGNYNPFRRIFIEGFERRVPLKGPVANVIEDHVLGVRLSMAAQGMSSIQELHENVSLMRGSNRKN